MALFQNLVNQLCRQRKGLKNLMTHAALLKFLSNQNTDKVKNSKQANPGSQTWCLCLKRETFFKYPTQ